jgi:hypothetical protein
VIFSGPSEIDQMPIVAIVTGIRRGSLNAKTAAMLQTWILRSDIPPSEARRAGADYSICGDCPLRDGACYVVLHQAPRSVFAAYRAGHYPHVPNDVGLHWAHHRAIRFGAYGDPAAVPARIWFELAANSRTWTGYTHAWRHPRMQPLRFLLMASVDTPEDAWAARAMGWRTFRTRLPEEAPLPFESTCPASTEGGQRTTCHDCGQCDGARAFDLHHRMSHDFAHLDRANAAERIRASGANVEPCSAGEARATRRYAPARPRAGARSRRFRLSPRHVMAAARADPRGPR